MSRTIQILIVTVFKMEKYDIHQTAAISIVRRLLGISWLGSSQPLFCLIAKPEGLKRSGIGDFHTKSGFGDVGVRCAG